MKYTTNSPVAICASIAMVWLVGCAPTTHVTETTTTREYDTTNPPVTAPVANSNTQPAPYAPPDQSTTTVTTDTNDGTVKKQTTTTYSTP
jgi:hypothetical protein